MMWEHQLPGLDASQLAEGEKITVRRQQCRKCKAVLALEIGRELGHNTDHYVARQALLVQGEHRILYEQQRWFGNFIVCPVCGASGKLPMDKPLNWEEMQAVKEQHG